ncbi:beta-propeller domain-containing protein [Paracholeplasma manati]|uniref:beta-propeller domain-containing protein n=1 Tax=Paracholeplasma manati TaxID=591373 RepID=UPI00240865A4|nr:beta-propeller domain-containing protein [Paracholeplasma manati]MDG0889512.1 beta-propeller domain-containing protein [Paracholeplasma manati]
MKKMFLVGLMFFSILFITGCQSTPKSMGLNAVGSLEQLKSIVKSAGNQWYYGPVAGVDMENGAEGDVRSEAKTSKTNVQVEGIDEGDIVKVDQNRIYQIFGNRLVVTSIDGAMTTLLNETLEDEKDRYTYFSELYITEDYLVVLGYSYQYFAFDIEGDLIATDAIGLWGYYGTSATAVWVYDIDTLAKVKTFNVPGYLNTTRLIDDQLYLISTSYINMYNEEIDPRPVYEIDGQKLVPEYDEIYYHGDLQAQVFNNITTIELSGNLDLTYDIFLGNFSWGTIYVSHQSIYFASYEYSYDEETGYQETGKLIAFDFVNEGVVFGGFITYKGYVINQFAIDEYDGYVRMVTTEGWGDTVKNRLYVFEKTEVEGTRTLTQVSLLDEGIGKPRERVFSVRFYETEATVVTFEQVDPFYMIDLSNPLEPTIAAALEIPGFSLYQHRWNDDTVLGIGYETSENRTIGIKLSLYDVTNPETLAELGTPLVLMNSENSWQYGEALYNHKAILFDIENNYFGFSVYKSYFTEYKYYNLNEYMIFKVDLAAEQSITVDKVITHKDYYTAIENDYWYYTPYSIERAVYVGDFLYVISSGAITKHDIQNDFNQVDVIQF